MNGEGVSHPGHLVIKLCSLRGRVSGSEPRGGGGHTASLKVATHCQATAPVFQGFLPLSFL